MLLADASADKWERTVDRLLDSPHFLTTLDSLRPKPNDGVHL